MAMDNPASVDQLPHFNLETMSGIFPGTRTRQFHVLKLLPNENGATHKASMTATGVEKEQRGGWAKAFWFEDSQSVVVIAESGEVLCKLENSDSATIFPELQQQIGEQRYQVASCGSCHHWTPSEQLQGEPSQGDAPSFGKCGWQSTLESRPDRPSQQDWSELGQELLPQSAFALRCAHWLPQAETVSANKSTQTNDAEMADPAESSFGSEPRGDVNLVRPGKQKVATEIDPEADGPKSEHQSSSHRPPKPADTWVRKISRAFGFGDGKSSATEASGTPNSRGSDSGSSSPSLQTLDRSGVGAGTEPCLGCHGRIANLGALVVETQEGDPQTYSVWRCRACGSTYLNSWVDRWERLENLETEEHLYRLAPMEAVHLLEHIYGVEDGDHPQARSGRTQSRAWFDSFRSSRSALNHQIRRGR